MTRSNVQRDPRYRIPPLLEAFVEFRFPNPDGRLLSMRLTDLSVAGLSFVADSELPLIVRGARIDGVTVLLGDIRMEGKLLIMHATPGGPRVLYGAVFYPATEEEQRKLSEVISGLASQA
jgi:hypothetical protein